MVANTEANGRFHSDWLSMMYPRLRLARNLLREDGVIFISIDDDELAQPAKACATKYLVQANFDSDDCLGKRKAAQNDNEIGITIMNTSLCYCRTIRQ